MCQVYFFFLSTKFRHFSVTWENFYNVFFLLLMWLWIKSRFLWRGKNCNFCCCYFKSSIIRQNLRYLNESLKHACSVWFIEILLKNIDFFHKRYKCFEEMLRKTNTPCICFRIYGCIYVICVFFFAISGNYLKCSVKLVAFQLSKLSHFQSN